MFGPARAWIGEQEITASVGRQGLLLLACLVLQKGASITREKVWARLWEDDLQHPTAVLRSRLRTALSRLRSALGDQGCHLVTFAHGDLAFRAADVHADVLAFDEASESAEDLASLDRCVQLYAGHMLVGYEAKWVVEERKTRRERYRHALRTLANHAWFEKDLAAAQRYVEVLSDDDPLGDEPWRASLRVLAAQGRLQDAIDGFARMTRVLAEHGRRVAPAATEFYTLIVSGAPDSAIVSGAAPSEPLFRPARAASPRPLQSTEGAVELPGEAPKTAAPFRVPMPRTGLVGRSVEISEATDVLAGHRLLTLVGGPGIGKTRVAIGVASAVRRQFPGGVWFVDARHAAVGEALLGALAVALGAADRASARLSDSIRRCLADERSLIVLDGCEGFSGECGELVQELGDICPGLSVLATSQRPLGLPSERVKHIGPLSAPAPEAMEASRRELVSVVLDHDGPKLMVQRMADQGEPTPQRATALRAILAIAHRLGGVPAYLEWVAGYCRGLSPEHVADHLDNVVAALLAEPTSQARALLDRSFGYLSDVERSTMLRLSMFEGSFDVQACPASCVEADQPTEGDVVPAHTDLRVLASLVDRSLVQRVSDDSMPDRYRLHDLVRQYCRAIVRQSGQWEYLRRSHRGWVVDRATAYEPGLLGPDAASVLQQIDAEYSDIMTVFDEAALDGAAPDQAVRVAASLRRYWMVRDMPREGLKRVDQALAMGEGEPVAKARALHARGWLAWQCDLYTEARVSFLESLQIARSGRHTHDVIAALVGLGWAWLGPGAYQSAGRCLKAARRLSERTSDTHMWCRASIGVACMHIGQGQASDALRLLAEALGEARRLGYRDMQAGALQNMSVVAKSVGRASDALAWGLEALELCRLLGDRRGECGTLVNVGLAAHLAHDLNGARGYFDQALVIQRRVADVHTIALIRLSIAMVELEEGRFAEARAHMAEALPTLSGVGNPFEVLPALEAFADVEARMGFAQRSITLFEAASTLRGTEYGLSDEERKEDDELIALSREHLDTASYERACAEGRTMSYTQAVAFALRPQDA